MRPRQLDRLEAPDDPARLGRQRIERATASRREPLGADVHPATVDDRRDRDELLERAGEPPRPEAFAARRVEREGRRVGCAVEPRTGDRDAVRAVVRRLQRVLPEQRAASNVECVDARCGVLQIHDVSADDRVRGDRTEARAACVQAEAPAHLEPRDRPRVELGRRSRPLAGDAPVRRRPGLRSLLGRRIPRRPHGEAARTTRRGAPASTQQLRDDSPTQKRRGRDSPGAHAVQLAIEATARRRG